VFFSFRKIYPRQEGFYKKNPEVNALARRLPCKDARLNRINSLGQLPVLLMTFMAII